jgi:NAD(P)-dependent dehydrogenase (short-subunit alcohol dehydrogenase family)
MNKTVLITGGTGALGTALVEEFLNSGDTVLVTDIREPTAEFLDNFSDFKNKLNCFVLNVLDETELKNFALHVKKSYNGLDILINVVGGFSMSKIMETSEAEFDKMINLNLKSTFLCSKVFLGQICDKQNGRIVNISARAGLHGQGGMGPYCISKGGVITLTQSIAEEVKETTATVNAILPSIIDTEANRKEMPDADFSKWVNPQDIANVISFLASEEARAISGASIPVYYKA